MKLKYKKIILFCILSCLLITLIYYTTNILEESERVKNAHYRTYTKEQLTEDLKQLEKYVLRENPMYFADRGEVEKLFSTTYKSIEENMTELEFYRLVNPIITSLNCGHTNLSISKALVKNRENTAKFFPLKLTLIDNEIYTLEDDLENNIYKGDRVLSINHKNNNEIISTLINNISSDGISEVKSRYIISKHFNNKFYDFIDNSNNFKVKLVDQERNYKIANLQAKYRSEFNTSAWQLHFFDLEKSNCYECKIYKDYAILDMNFFIKEKGNNFDDFLDDFFSLLKEKNIPNLIIDLRGNYGGDPHMAKSLLSFLTSNRIDYFTGDLPVLYDLMGYKNPISPADNRFEGNIYIFTDGAAFSTTGHFCSIVKHHKIGTIIGSETAGGFVCTDSSKNKVLANTKLRIHYSTLTYKVAVNGLLDNHGIEPDIYISPSIDDIVYNKDVYMEKVKQIINLN